MLMVFISYKNQEKTHKDKKAMLPAQLQGSLCIKLEMIQRIQGSRTCLHVYLNYLTALLITIML
jgi:hypothetical protein